MAGYRGFAEWVADDFVFWRDLGLSMARVDPPVAWHVPQVLPSDIGRPHTAPVIISLTRSSHFRRRGRFGNRRLIRRRLWFAGEAFAGALALVGARPARRSSPDPSRRQPHQRRPRGRRTPVDHRPAAPVASGRPVDPATAATAAEADELLRSVSAVIPVRGPARLLTEQLAALGNHVAEIDGEIVIADNGSPSLATVLRPDLPCTIRVVPALGGRGASYARNLGAAAARGDVVVCCDADDIAAPHFLHDIVGALRAADLVTGLSVRHPGPERARVNAWLGLHHDHREDDAPGLYGRAFVHSWSLAVRAATLRKLGGFDEALAHGEDIDLALLASAEGLRIGVATTARFQYRLRTTRRALLVQQYRYSRSLPRVIAKHRPAGLTVPPGSQLMQAVRLARSVSASRMATI